MKGGEAGSMAGQLVTIKGNKDGLVFLFDDRCAFADLMAELQDKLENTHQKILSGPLIHVDIKLGNREITRDEKERIRKLFQSRGNLIIRSIESASPSLRRSSLPMHIHKGMVRSGQTLNIDGHLLLLGDVNPGGVVVCTGDIYVLGSLKGTAHAGSRGDELAVIAASLMRPTQLRIARVFSRPPDEWLGDSDNYMEFAYLREGRMELDKISQLQRLRPEALHFKGE